MSPAKLSKLFGAHSVGPKEPCIRRGRDPQGEGAVFELSTPLGVFAAVHAKPAEPIEMPFGERTHVGPRNHVLGGVKVRRTHPGLTLEKRTVEHNLKNAVLTTH